MYGLGKERTRLGRFLDRNGIKQEPVRLKAGIGRDIMGELCGNNNYSPQEKTVIKVIGALRLLGYDDVEIDDFW